MHQRQQQQQQQQHRQQISGINRSYSPNPLASNEAPGIGGLPSIGPPSPPRPRPPSPRHLSPSNFPSPIPPPFHPNYPSSSSAHPSHAHYHQQPGSATFFESPMITLIAGPAKKRFWAHKDVLCNVPFFRQCLDASFLDTHHNVLELPDDDPDAVGAMVSFLYQDEYTPRIVRSVTGARSLEPLPSGQPHTRSMHIHVHMLSEKYTIAALRELAFRKIFLINAPDEAFLDFLREVYALTPQDSKLRYCNRLEEYWVFGLHEKVKEMRASCPGLLDDFLEECPEFTRDLVLCLSFAVDSAFAASNTRGQEEWGDRLS